MSTSRIDVMAAIELASIVLPAADAAAKDALINKDIMWGLFLVG